MLGSQRGPWLHPRARGRLELCTMHGSEAGGGQILKASSYRDMDLPWGQQEPQRVSGRRREAEESVGQAMVVLRLGQAQPSWILEPPRRWAGLDSTVSGIRKVSLVGGGVILWAKEQWCLGERRMAMGS